MLSRKKNPNKRSVVKQGSLPFVCVRKRKASSCQMAPSAERHACSRRHKTPREDGVVSSHLLRRLRRVLCPPFHLYPPYPCSSPLPTPSFPLLPLAIFLTSLSTKHTYFCCRSRGLSSRRLSDRRPEVCPTVTGGERREEGVRFGDSPSRAHMAASMHAPHPSLAVTLARQRDFNQTGPSI